MADLFSQPEKAQLGVDGIKAGTAWASAGMTASDVAAWLAAFYTGLLIGDWFWKKIIRSQALKRGWIKPQPSTDRDGE